MSVTRMVQAHNKMIEDYLSGRLQKPAAAAVDGEEPHARIRLTLPRQNQTLIQEGPLDIDVRICKQDVARIREGQLVNLGELVVKVNSVSHFSALKDVLLCFGVSRVISGEDSLRDAVQRFHDVSENEEEEQQFGVIALVVEPVISGKLNVEQKRFADAVLPNVENAIKYHWASNEREADACRVAATESNRVAVCLGPPGTGKSFAMHY